MKKKLLLIIIIVFIFSGCNKENNNSTSTLFDEISTDGMYLYSTENLFENFQYIYLAEIYGTGIFTYACTKDNPAEANLFYCDTENNSINMLTYATDKSFPILSLSATNEGVLWILESDLEEEYKISIFTENEALLFEHDIIKDSMPFKIIVDETNEKIYIHSLDLQDDSEYIYMCLTLTVSN